MQKIFKQSLTIKIIAILIMVIDHVGAILFPQVWWLRLIGRLGSPLFPYLLAVGFDKTKNKTSYGIRLGLFALISQYFYTLAFQPSHLTLNIFFTLFLSFLLLVTLTKKYISNAARFGLSAYLILLSIILPIEYGIFGVLCVISWYYLRKKQFWLIISQIFLWGTYPLVMTSGDFTQTLITNPVILQIISPLVIGIVWFMEKKISDKKFFYVSDRTKTAIQYGFYAFYPLHLLLLYLLQ